MKLISNTLVTILSIITHLLNSLKNKNIRAICYVYLFSYLAAPLGYIIKILFSKELSLEQFGLMYAIIGLYTLFSIGINLGLPQSFNYYGVKHIKEKKYSKFKSLFCFTLCIQTVLLLCCTLFIHQISNYLAIHYFKIEYASGLLILFALYFIFSNLLKTITFSYLAVKNYLASNLITITQLSILILAILFFPLSTQFNTLIGLVWGIPFIITFILFTTHFIFTNSLIFKSKLQFTKSLLTQNLKYGAQIVIGSSGLYLITRVDTLFLTYFFSVSDVGVYEVALSTAMILSTLFNPINKFLFPYTSEKKFDKSLNILEKICFKMYHIMLYFSLPFVGIFVVYSKEIMTILFPNSFIYSVQILPILSFAIFFFIFQQLNFSILAGLNKLRIRNTILIAGAILNIVLNIVLIEFIGVLGIAYASLISFSIIFVYSYITLIQQKILILFNLKMLGINGIAIIVFLLSIFVLKSILEFSFPYGLLIESIIVLSISTIIYLCFGIILFKRELKEFFNKII